MSDHEYERNKHTAQYPWLPVNGHTPSGEEKAAKLIIDDFNLRTWQKNFPTKRDASNRGRTIEYIDVMVIFAHFPLTLHRPLRSLHLKSTASIAQLRTIERIDYNWKHIKNIGSLFGAHS